MNATTTSSSSCPRTLYSSFHRYAYYNRPPLVVPTNSLPISSTSFPRRHRNRHPRRRLRRIDPFQNPTADLSFSSVDLDEVAGRATSAISRHLRRLLSSGEEALEDLRSSLRVDPGGRIAFSCRQSSLLFARDLLLLALAAAVTLRVLAQSWLLVFGWMRRGREEQAMVVRRDRSLGGREVVVKKKNRNDVVVVGRKPSVTRKAFPVTTTRVEKRKLPEWWHTSSASVPLALLVGREEYQREADRLVRAIVDNRMRGMDYKDDDIVQLRHLCRTFGLKISFGTENVRDSFFRASVDFVLNTCSRVAYPDASVQIDGEEARKFICGLADNIGLDNVRAARIICAAVAARTRSCFLQTWAMEVQEKRAEALQELSKICQALQTFPPEENSPEMEMVANGLKKNLGVEQREHLLALFKRVCGSKSHRAVEEALGLVNDQSATWQSFSSRQ